jgi:hypothetical protein
LCGCAVVAMDNATEHIPAANETVPTSPPAACWGTVETGEATPPEPERVHRLLGIPATKHVRLFPLSSRARTWSKIWSNRRVDTWACRLYFLPHRIALKRVKLVRDEVS